MPVTRIVLPPAVPAADAPTSTDGMRAFALCWRGSLALLILNLGVNLNLGNINALEKLGFLVAAVFYLRNKRLSRPAVAGLSLMLGAVFLFGALTGFPEFEWTRTLFAVIALLSCASLFLAPPAPAERELMLRAIAWTPPFLVAYSLLLAVLFGKPLWMQDHTGVTRLGGATIPAFMAAAGYAGSVAAAYLYAAHGRPRHVGLAMAGLVICALSGTRMPTVCAAASAGLILLIGMRSAGARIALTALGALGAAAFLATAGNQLLIRFLSGSSSGREDIWAVLGAWVDRYPLTGVGFGHHGLLIPERISRLTGTVAAHNEYLRLLVELGYIGQALFLAGLGLLFLATVCRRGALPLCASLLLLAAFFTYATTDNVFYLTYALFVPLAVAMGSSLLTAPEDDRHDRHRR